MTERDLSLQTQSLQHFGNKVLRKTKMLAMTLDTRTASVKLVYIAVRRYSFVDDFETSQISAVDARFPSLIKGLLQACEAYF